MPEMNRDEIAKLEALYASNPEGRVFTHLAEAYRKAGDYERARGILEQGLEKHPGYASAHVVLGRVFIDLNEIPQARAAFRHVLELDPHNLVALRSLGELSRLAGNTDEALTYFEELRHQDPSNPEIDEIISELKSAPAAPEAEAAPAPAAEAESGEPGASGSAPTAEVIKADRGPAAGTFEEPRYAATPQPEPLEELPGFENAQPDYGDLVSPDIDLGWTAGAHEETLPGDLAELAAQPAGAETEGLQGETEGEPMHARAENQVPESELEQPRAEAEQPAAEAEGEQPQPEAEAELPEPEPEFTVFETEVEVIEVTELVDVDLGAPEAPEAAEPEAAVFDFSDLEQQPEEQPAYETFSVDLPEPEPPIWAQASGEPQPFEQPVAEEMPASAGDITREADLDGDDAAPDDLVTETMAELLVEQGLHDAAADVYRALIRERPWDPDLKQRLMEIEAMSRMAAASPSEEPVESAEHDLEAESPWTSAPAAAASAATPYAWTEDASAEPEDAGPPIRQYFRSLLSWRPGDQTEPVAAQVHAAEPEPEPEVANFEPTAASASQPAIAEMEMPAAAEPAGAQELMPWDVAEPEPLAERTPAAPAAPAAKSDNPVEAAFDEWFNAPEESSSAQSAPAPVQPDHAEGEGEDDDDLEMFRSWLQSLKK